MRSWRWRGEPCWSSGWCRVRNGRRRWWRPLGQVLSPWRSGLRRGSPRSRRAWWIDHPACCGVRADWRRWWCGAWSSSGGGALWRSRRCTSVAWCVRLAGGDPSDPRQQEPPPTTLRRNPAHSEFIGYGPTVRLRIAIRLSRPRWCRRCPVRVQQRAAWADLSFDVEQTGGRPVRLAMAGMSSPPARLRQARDRGHSGSGAISSSG
jgi:hypothetical protein